LEVLRSHSSHFWTEQGRERYKRQATGGRLAASSGRTSQPGIQSDDHGPGFRRVPKLSGVRTLGRGPASQD